jgi:hypothetical protein
MQLIAADRIGRDGFHRPPTEKLTQMFDARPRRAQGAIALEHIVLQVRLRHDVKR